VTPRKKGAAVIRQRLAWIEQQLEDGFSRQAVLTMLKEQDGLDLTFSSFLKTLQRARLEAPARMKATRTARLTRKADRRIRREAEQQNRRVIRKPREEVPEIPVNQLPPTTVNQLPPTTVNRTPPQSLIGPPLEEPTPKETAVSLEPVFGHQPKQKSFWKRVFGG
jgi:hypothetical protein